MPTQFKGTRIEFSKIEIQGRASGSKINVSVLFCDVDGLTHAITNHILEPSVSEEVLAATQALMTALQAHIEKNHYYDAGGESPATERRPSVAGIAETFARMDNPTRDPIEQG